LIFYNMKIAVIGNGLIGSIASVYLSKKGYEVDCIGPDIDTAKREINNLEISRTLMDFELKKSSISPKFYREDLKRDKVISDKLFQKETKNFFSLEIADDNGLGKYWGANLAINSLKPFIKELNLNSEEIQFINNLVPQLKIQDFYNENFLNLNTFKFKTMKNIKIKNNLGNIESSVLSLWKEKFDINNLPNYKFSPAIFGSLPLDLGSTKRIKGVVRKIELDQKKDNFISTLFIDDSKEIFTKNYNYVFLACGSIGSYRLLMNCFNDKDNQKLFSRIKHHPMISTLVFIPYAPYPEKHIGMSNLDLNLKIDDNQIFTNFHPFESFLKMKYNLKLKNNNNYFFKLIYKFLNNISFMPLSPLWIIRRLYIAAIYLPGELSSSYIGIRKNEVKIIGGLRSDYEKYICNKIWKNIVSEFKKNNVFNFLMRPVKIKLGADFHYSSSLINYTDDKGIFIKNESKTNIVVLDASSSRILPTPNPTFYFICRAIRLLRDI